MNAGDIVSDWRSLVNEPGTNRFTVQDSLTYLNKASIQLATDIPFTEGTYTFPTVANQKEYAMLETIRILRVYILGPNGVKQLIEPTDIPSMEGENQNYFDQSSGTIQGQPILTPQWIAEQSVQYPYTPYNSYGQGRGGYGTSSFVWTHGSPPKWYMRYGNIGFVPPPNGVFTVNVDHIPLPPTVTATNQLLEFPEIYRDALMYKMAEYSRQADGSQDSIKNQQLYAGQVAKIKQWWDKFQATKATTFVPWIRRNRRGRGYRSNGWYGY